MRNWNSCPSTTCSSSRYWWSVVPYLWGIETYPPFFYFYILICRTLPMRNWNLTSFLVLIFILDICRTLPMRNWNGFAYQADSLMSARRTLPMRNWNMHASATNACTQKYSLYLIYEELKQHNVLESFAPISHLLYLRGIESHQPCTVRSSHGYVVPYLQGLKPRKGRWSICM